MSNPERKMIVSIDEVFELSFEQFVFKPSRVCRRLPCSFSVKESQGKLNGAGGGRSPVGVPAENDCERSSSAQDPRDLIECRSMHNEVRRECRNA
jgi:hypothetical protein